MNEPKLTEFDVNQLNSRLHTVTDNENFHIIEPEIANLFTKKSNGSECQNEQTISTSFQLKLLNY